MTPTAMVRYSAGPWLGLVRGRSLVALPADASEETAAVLWDLLAGTPGVEQLLATVLSGRLDLTGMPSFAIVSFDGQDVHAILRGDVHLRMTGLDDAESRLGGTGVSTWNERRVPGVRSFELLVDDALPNAENLPLDAGAVRLASLQADLVPPSQESEPCPEVRAAQSEAAPESAPEPVAASEAEVVPEPGPEPEPAREPEPAAEAPEPEAEPDPEPDPEPEPDIGMTIAPDAAEFTAAHAAPDAPQPSGQTTRIQPAEPEKTAPEETAPEEIGPDEEPDDSTIASRPPSATDPSTDPSADSATDAATDAAPARPAAPVPGPQELIDSVPWLAAARRAAPADLGQTVAPEAHPDDDADADTVLSPSPSPSPFPSAAAPEPPARAPEPPSGPPQAVPADPDHDGQTVMRSDLDLAGVGTEAPPTPAPVPPITGPVVLARQCSDGHANPPTSSTCTVCGQSLGGEARQVRRPALGRIRMSTGEVLDLDRPAVIGRQPQAHRVGSGTMPRMIQVRSPNGDISRSHCEVVLEGWHVQLRDLKATNGTVLIREGAAPRRLGQGESVMVLDGDIADLGDGVSVRFEGIP